jgi:hypothetical protein
MATHDMDEWLDGATSNYAHTTPHHQPMSANMAGKETMKPAEEDVKAMRAIVSEAVLLFAKKRHSLDVTCFKDKDTDWQLALSDAIVLRDHPTLANCTECDAVFFIRISETKTADPRVFVAGVIGSPQPSNHHLRYTCRFYQAVPPGWRGSDEANARCNPNDVAPLAQFILECLYESVMNQMPKMEEVCEGAEDC